MRTRLSFLLTSTCLALFALPLFGCSDEPTPRSINPATTAGGTGGMAGAGGSADASSAGGMAGMAGSGGAGGTGGTSSVIHEPQGTSLLVQVLDTSNKPIPSALVTALGDSMRPTDGAGYILYENLVPGRFSARVEQWGYAPASVVVDVFDGAHGGTFVRLVPLTPRIAFDAAAGAALDQGPVHVTIPSNAIVDANGEPYTGMAEATIVPLDPTTDLVNAPGPLQGLDANGQIVGLQSFYMAEVTLWNGAQKLQLAPGKKATIEMVLPDSIAANVQLGQSIPAWFFDLDVGIWREDGAGTIGASIAEPGKTSWVTQVGHFTWWNCDAPWTEKHCYNVRLLDTDGNGVPNLPVSASGSGWNSSTKLSSKPGGYACIDVKKGASGQIFVGNESMPIASHPITVSNDPPAACGQPGTMCQSVELFIPSNTICQAGENESCAYSGPPGTLNVGNCKAGSKWCNATGTAWEDCVGEVLPQPESCNMAGDEDCDNVLNESGIGCQCMPSEKADCYTGPSGTLGVGICDKGQRVCQGGFFGPCVGQKTPIIETCATPDDDNCDGTDDCNGIGIWSKRFGDSAGQYARSIAVDNVGNIVVAGGVAGIVDFGGGSLVGEGSLDIFLAKFNAGGDHVWSRRFGTVNGVASVQGIAIDTAGNVAVSGAINGGVDLGAGPLTNLGGGGEDVFIAKFDPAGNHLWSKRFGDGANQSATALAVDNFGNILITGPFQGTVDFGNGPLTSVGNWDVFVARFGTSGDVVWSRRFGDASYQVSRDIAMDNMGNFVITGDSQGTVDFGGGPLPLVSSSDVFVAKFDASGNHIWSSQYGNSGEGVGNAVAILGTGNVVIAENINGSVDFGGGLIASSGDYDIVLANFDSNGNHIWSKHFGDSNAQRATAITSDDGDNIFLAGRFDGIVDFGGVPLTSLGEDIVIVKFDSNGNHIWSRRYGDWGYQVIDDATIDTTGSIIAAGQFQGNLDFGTGMLSSTGGSDIFVAKLTP